MNTQDKIQMNLEKQGLYCITVGELKSMFNIAANNTTIIDKTAERICGSELEEVVVYADKEKLTPILREFAAEIWTEAVDSQSEHSIEYRCKGQLKYMQDIYRTVMPLEKLSVNPYITETESK